MLKCSTHNHVLSVSVYIDMFSFYEVIKGKMLVVRTGAARGGLRGPVPPVKSAQFHKNYLRKMKW